MKKLVLKIDMPDAEAKRKAMKTVAAFPGIDSISIDMKERKLTIIGTVDPTKVVSRLRKYWTTELVTVGPAKEPEKKAEEPKKDDSASSGGETKKQGGDEQGEKKEGVEGEKKRVEEGIKKEEQGGGGGEAAAKGGEVVVVSGGGGEKKEKAEEAEEEEEKKMDPVLEMVKAYRAYNPHMTKYYYVQSMEENPNACIIC